MSRNNRVVVFTRYSASGPSSRVRFFQYFPYLEEAGFDLNIKPFFYDGYIESLFNQKRCSYRSILQSYAERLRECVRLWPGDTVWLQYELLPWLPVWFEKFLLNKPIRLVIDFDDAVFHRYDQHKAWPVRALLGNKIDRLMRFADVVTVGNEYLAGRARRAGARYVEIIPSVMDLSRYPTIEHRKNSTENIRVGWIGTPQTVKHVSGVAPVIKAITDRGISFVLIGAKKPAALEGLPVEEITWSLETEAESIRSVDIGIMPLPNNPFERGKCGYKLIQYMACGLPVVASPVGVNKELVRHKENGFLAECTSEWTDSICKLAKDPVLRQKMGKKGRKLIENNFNLGKWAEKIIQVLNDQ